MQYLLRFSHCREKLIDLPTEVVNALFFLEEFAHYSHMPRRVRPSVYMGR